MIVPMKKLSVLLYHAEKASFMASLQELGVVHVVEDPEAHSPKLKELVEKMKAADRVGKSLKRISDNRKLSFAQKNDRSPQEIISEFDRLETELEKTEQNISSLKKSLAALMPWGDFEWPSIDRLKEAGLSVRFFEASTKTFNSLEKTQLNYEIINNTPSTVLFIVLERGEAVRIDAEEVILPHLSISDAKTRIEKLLKDRDELERSLGELTAYSRMLQGYMAENHINRTFEAVRLSMKEGAEGKLLSLNGWLPSKNEKRVAEFLDKFAAWYSIDLPSVDDNVPVKMTNNRFSKLFEPITKIFALPDYFELDPTPFIAPFFTLFFGLCLGDMGYGLILVIASLIALKKMPANLKPIVILILVFGIMTTLTGFLLNTFFGHAIFAVPGMDNGYFQKYTSLALLTPLETETGTMFPAMSFAIYLGIIQIILGITLQAINKVKNNRPIFCVSPLGKIIMVFGITVMMVKINFIDLKTFSFGMLKIGDILSSLPEKSEWIFIFSGLAMVLLFNNPDKKIYVRFGIGLWELYQFATGLMGDALSYLRLFALGLAGGMLGSAFNDIAFMLITKDNTIHYSSPMIVATVAILIIGHTINFALALLGSFVHSLRLTFVEFYKNLEFKGGAKPFIPFAKTTAD